MSIPDVPTGGKPGGLPISPPPASPTGTFGTARRLRAIQHRTGRTDLAALADEVAAIEDRLLYAEAAIAHLTARFGLDPHALPDPLRPRLHVTEDDRG